MVRALLIISTLFMFCLSCVNDKKAAASSTNNDNGSTFTSTIPPAEFLEKYHAQQGAVMVDVRTAKEFSQGAMVPTAVNVDFHDNFLENILLQPKDDPIFIYCFSGGRSSKAAYKMRQLGFDRIYECEGGYQRWEKEVKK